MDELDAVHLWHDERNDGEATNDAFRTVVDRLVRELPDDQRLGEVVRAFVEEANSD